MTKQPKPRYLVVLRDGFQDNELEFLMRFTNGLKLSSGKKLRVLQCSAIESESYYLRADVIIHGHDTPMVVRIQHGFILTIVGEEENAPPGFLGSLEVEKD